MEKPQETACEGPQVECGRVSGNIRVGNSDNQVDGAHLQILWEKCSKKKNNGFCPHFCLGESCSNARYFKRHQLCPWWLLSCCLSTEAQTQWVQISLCAGHLRGAPGTPAALCVTQPQSPLVCSARSHGDFSSQHWNPGSGAWYGCRTPCSSWGTSIVKISLLQDFLSKTHVCGVCMFCVSAPPTSLDVASSYILSCRTSFQLDFRQFWMVIVPYFNVPCIFDVVVGEFEYHTYPCCHLDQKACSCIYVCMYLRERERERERERNIDFCCSSYLCIHWLVPMCALTRDWTTTLVYQDQTLTRCSCIFKCWEPITIMFRFCNIHVKGWINNFI